MNEVLNILKNNSIDIKNTKVVRLKWCGNRNFRECLLHTFNQTSVETFLEKWWQMISVSFELFSSVELLSHVWLFVPPWIAVHQDSLCITNSRSLPNPCPLSRWYHPAISSSVIPFSSCPQSFPASESFQMSQIFTSGGQSIAVSASTSVLPMNTQDWSPLEWTGWISLESKGLSRVFSNTTVQKHQFFCTQLSL